MLEILNERIGELAADKYGLSTLPINDVNTDLIRRELIRIADLIVEGKLKINQSS